MKSRRHLLTRVSILAVVAGLFGLGAAAVKSGAQRATPPPGEAGAPPPRPSASVASPFQAPPARPVDAALFQDAARTAWAYAERQYQPETGLINSVINYPFATMWDTASALAALYCANQLGLLPDEEYDRRMRRALQTLRTMRLFDGITYNKNYSTRTGAIAGRDDRERRVRQRGYGYSTVDLGRLLVWLRIIAVNQPQYAAEVEAIIARQKLSRLVEGGYLWGESLNRAGRLRRYMEGRIPYEQYAAQGFALWGHRAEKALQLQENALPISVYEVPLVADRRGHDHLTSEPLVLMGLELGWPPELEELASGLLKVQEERHRRTGVVTIVSEDAIPRPPYFFYYTVNFHGKQFAVVTPPPNVVLQEPRWVSAKAAFGWHALLHTPYTRVAVETVARAGNAQKGWASGVYERSGQPTGSENINTAAVILEAALYNTTGRPLLERR